MSVALAAHRGARTTRALVEAVTALVDPEAGPSIGVALRDAEAATLLDAELLVLDIDEALRGSFAGRVVTVGLSSADLTGTEVSTALSGTRFTAVGSFGELRITLALVGERHVVAALAAIAVGLELGLEPQRIVSAIETVTVPGSRDLEVVAAGSVTIIDDGYDAGVRSSVEALKTIAELADPGQRSVAVLGALAIGPTDPIAFRDEHDRLGRIIVRLNIGQLIVVGDDARHLAAAAGLEGSWDGESRLVSDLDGAYDLLRADLRAGDILLVKIPWAEGGDLAEKLGVTAA